MRIPRVWNPATHRIAGSVSLENVFCDPKSGESPSYGLAQTADSKFHVNLVQDVEINPLRTQPCTLRLGPMFRGTLPILSGIIPIDRMFAFEIWCRIST